MPTVNVNGQHLYYEDTGSNAPAVVFSHGFLMDHTMFASQVDALADEFRCITWDQRGFGQTPAIEPFTYYDSANDLLGLLDHLNIGKAVLVGMSQGGFVGLRAALFAPERVAGLVLIDSQAGLENPDAVPLYDAMRDEWISNGPTNVQETVAGIIMGGGYDATPWYPKWAALPTDGFALAYQCLVGRDDVTVRLGDICCPAIVFHGDQDQAIPLDRAHQLHTGLANSQQIVIVQGAGHAANLSHPEQINDPLREFLRQHAT